MASPQLKKTAVVAPPRRLINSGVVPTTQVRLKGIGGQVIKPKAPVSPLKKKETTKEATAPETEAPETATPIPPAPEAAAETPAAQTATPAATGADTETATKTPETAPETTEAAPEAAPEAAEAAQSDEEAAAAQAQSDYEREMEEYNRQMEEYNRQMEEYNRQMAELAEQEAATAAMSEEAPPAPEDIAGEAPATNAAEGAAVANNITDVAPVVAAPEPVAAPTPTAAPKPAAKLSVKKPALSTGQKKKSPLAAKPAAAPEDTGKETQPETDSADATDEAELLAQLEYAAQKTPIWKSKLFIGASVLLLLCAGGATYAYLKQEARNAIIKANNEKVMKVLIRAQEINKSQVETLADAKAKGVNVTFTPEDANFLMDIVVNPGMRDQFGNPMFGNKPDGAAQLAVLAVGLACEENNSICKTIFARLDKEAPKIKPDLYRWLLQRLTATDIKGLNAKMRTLANAVSSNKTPGFKSRDVLLSYIWECMGLRVEAKDLTTILKQLEQEEQDKKLTLALLNCLYLIVKRTENPTERAELGDRIFDALSEPMRVNAAESLALSCSPKALEFFKARAEDPQNLKSDATYFSNYGSDDILPYLLELRDKTADDKKLQGLVPGMIRGLFGRNRERTPEQAKALLAAIPDYDKVDIDLSDWMEVNEKTDPDAGTFVGENNPQYAQLMERKKEMEIARTQRQKLIQQLSYMLDYDWVLAYLNRFASEGDPEIAHNAKRALEKVKENRLNEEAQKAKFNARDKN